MAARARQRGGSEIIWLVGVVLVLVTALAFFLWPTAETDLVVYCGVDQNQSQQMVQQFRDASGLTVRYQGEGEAFRSVGLPKRLRLEASNPQADVYWSNEIMHMVALANDGLIDPLPTGLAERFPEAWRDPGGRFLQFGARARILLVNLELLPDEADHPTRVADVIDPRWREQGLFACMAAPLTGTTYTHAVAMLTADEAGGLAFLDAVAKGGAAGRIKVVASNGRVMRAVTDTSQKVAFGLTDTDDALIAIERMKAGTGPRVRVVYPDQDAEGPGTVLIPNTAGLVKGARHPDAARRFLAWLSGEEIEAILARGPSAQIPVRPSVGPLPDHVKRPPTDFRAARIDWHAVGRNANRWHDQLTALFRPAD